MAEKTSAELRKFIFDVASKSSEKFKSKFKNFDSFNKALDDKDYGGDLVQKILEAQGKLSETFRNKFPDYTSLSSALAVNSKYTGKQRHDLREVGKNSLKSLYKGDFEKLWNNRDQLRGKVANLKNALAQGGNVSTQKSMEIQKAIMNLKRGIELVDAYNAIDISRSDEDFDNLIAGKIPPNPELMKYENWSDSDKQAYDSLSPNEQAIFTPNTGMLNENKFIKQVMPTAQYKAIELQGREPSITESLFPEYSRRDREGGSGLSQIIGGAKDVLRMTGRAIRPIAEDIMGTRDPNTTYREEFARPDKYKTSTQEMGDEVLGLQGVGGTVAKLGAMQVGKRIPALARGFNKVLPFINPAEKLIGRVGGNVANQSLAKQGIRNVLSEAPNIALDVGYEATRSDDEVSNPLLAGLGGATGAFASPFIGVGANKFLDKFTGNSELRKEIMAGSPTMLNQELQLAKAMMPDADLISSGGRGQIEEMQKGLGAYTDELGNDYGGKIGQFGDERRALSRDLDKRLEQEYIDQEYSNLKGRDRLFGGSDELTAMNNIQDKYLEQLSSGVHPSKQNQIAEELKRVTGVNIPSGTDLMAEAKKLKISNGDMIPNSAMLKLEKDLAKTKGIGEQYKIYKAFKESFPDAKPYRGEALTKAPSIEQAFDSRTELRQNAKGEGEFGVSKPIFEKAEEIQKNVMNDYLTKSAKGRAIKAKHDKMAELYGLKDKLPDLTNGTKVDAFFEKIGRSRMNISTKANTFDDMLKLQDDINRETGLNTDFVTNAVLRRIQNKSFWNDYLGEGNAGLVNKAFAMAKDLSGKALTGGKLQATLAQIARLAKEKDSTKESQENAKRNTGIKTSIKEATSLFDDQRMKSIISDIDRRKESDRMKLNLQGNR